MRHRDHFAARTFRRIALPLLLILGAFTASSQTTVTTYQDDFQSYGKSKKPDGWIDGKVGDLLAKPRGYYKTEIDPTQDNQGTNLVFGTKKSLGDEADEIKGNRIGYFGTYIDKTFSGSGRFEIQGRMIVAGTKSRIGLVPLTAYPAKDQYYIIEERTNADNKVTLQLSSYGIDSKFDGKLDSKFELTDRKWYRFRLQVDDLNGVTRIKARFWADGEDEPVPFALDVTDSSATRLKAGHFGIWAGGGGDSDDGNDPDSNGPPVKGIYIDDVTAKSPSDHTAPVIQFFETGKQLPTDSVTQFGRDAHIDIRVTDDLSTFTYTAKLDGAAYKSLDPISAEGPHTVTVHAIDAAGNAGDAQVQILIDKTPPVITLTESGKPLDPKYNRNIAIDIKVTDALTAVTFTATLDGAPYVSGTPVTTEGKHVLLVTAKDNVGNPSSAQATVLVDKSAPLIAFYESGNKVDSTNARFKADAHIEIRVTDVVSTATYTATVDGNPYKSLDAIAADGWHKIVVNAIDEAGNPASATLDFLVDHNAPVVKFYESGVELDPSQLAKYARTAAIEIKITDATSKVTSTAKVNNVDYVSLTPISNEGRYTLAVHAVDEAGNVTDATLNILVDKTAPIISFYDGTTQLDPRTTLKFRRDVAIDIKATDAVSSASFTATLDGAPYAANTLVTSEALHRIAVHAVDTAGNTADATLDFIVDKTLPVIDFLESGNPLDTTKTTNFGRDVKVEIKVTDNLPNVTYTAKLDGNDYKSLDPITADGTHVVSVHAIDGADNTADKSVSVLIDKTAPVIAFYEGTTKLDTTARQKFNHKPAIEIRVTDATTTPAFTATLDGAPYVSGTPVGEGNHTIAVHATDTLGNPADAKLDLLVDETVPVVKLKEGNNDLPPSGAIFNHDLAVKAEITDVSQTTTVATLDGNPFSLSVPIAGEGTHALKVVVTDELNWSTTVNSSFIVDKTPPKISVFEGTNPLSAGSSFARDVVINATADDITHATLTATLDGNPFALGSTVSQNGDHTLVVNAVDEATNHSDPVTILFHIDKERPEVVLLESGAAFPQKKTFTRDVVVTVDIKAATQTTSVATIDDASYTLGQPYAPEGKHHVKVVVTNIAGLSTTVEADFTIDKTPPTIKLFAKPDLEFADNVKFAADITPVAQADDNLSKPPKVVVTLDGQTLSPGTVVSEEKFHTISATATDDGGLSTTAGPYHFVIDKSGPKVTITVDDKPLVTGDKFNKAITPKIVVDDLTTTTIAATLDGNAYTPDTLISADGKHTLAVTVTDDLGNKTSPDPITFTIDKTPPVVTVTENDQTFVSGSKYKRNVTPVVHITDTTETTTIATVDGNPWTSGQEVSSEGIHKLEITVTDELAWSTVVPAITFTIDKTAPAVKITESDATLTDGQIFNRDARPKITVTDTTQTTIEATLDGQPFTSESLVSVEGKHLLVVKVTDELGFVTEVPAISFIVDKTPPVVTIVESGHPFADNSLLNHDAVPHATIVDVTSTTVTAKLDGADYTLDTAIPAEGAHTLDVVVKDAAGWVTTVPTIHFFIDKTPPVIAVTESGTPLVTGAEFNRTIKPNIKITDISATTVDAKLDGQPFTSDSDVAAEGEQTLTVTATDAAGWSTTIPPIVFVIDKTAPVVTIRESGADFVTGSKFNRNVLPQIVIVDLTKTTIDAKLDGNAYTPDTPITVDGKHTLTVTVTDHLGWSTTVPPIAFTLDKTPPVVAVTEAGKTLVSGAIFSRTVKPEISIQDLTQTTTVALLDDAPFTFGTDITAEGRHTLNVTVTDELGWSTSIPPIAFAIDKTAPEVTLVEDNKPFATGSLFNRDVKPEAVIKDVTDTTTTATLDGAPFTLGTVITAEGQHTLIVKVEDSVGLVTNVPPVVFTIDKTAPVLVFISPAPNSTVATAQVVVTGDADDAVTVAVNGVPADVDLATKKFTTTAPIDLSEGENTLVGTATDKAGNTGATPIKVFLDSRAPQLTITSPAANFCTKEQTITISGRSADAHAREVKFSMTPGSVTPVTVTPAADGTFTGSITAPGEGEFIITVEAKDAVGHVATSAIAVTVDKTAPVITVNSRGVAFAGGPISYQPALFIKITDADASTVVTATLNNDPYTSGSAILADGSYTLKVNAHDCAGNAAPETTIAFVVDTHAPRIVTIDPAAGSTITTSSKTITGTMEQADTRSLTIAGTPYAATINGTSFSIAGVALHEGINSFNLVAVDNAGNSTQTAYSFSVKTTTPQVTITEGGAPIAPNAVFNRTVTPSITSNESGAHVTATLDGAAYVSDTPISAEGSHTINATASDDVGHSSQATATFTIDRGAPAVTIASPADGSTTTADHIEVRGTALGGGIAGVSVNGVVATVAADGSFTAANVPLDFGTNAIIATALDQAGNSGTATITVTRGNDKFGIALTSPADKSLTNRHSITVAGQLLSQSNSGVVTINGTEVPVDATGAFKKTDFALTEGENVITAAVRGTGGTTNSASVTITADFTPPVLKVLADTIALENGARFAMSPTLTIQATDTRPEPVTVKLTVDGSVVTPPVSGLADGGHALTAIAHDGAGNETRVDRTFAIGAGANSGGACSLTSFDPANNSSVYNDDIKISGRTGASGVLVNGTKAYVSDGSFTAHVTLQIGRNDIAIRCADAAGNPTGDAPVTLTLYRYTDATITITTPHNGDVSTTDKLTVTGTVTDGVVAGDVNGLDFTPAGGAYSVSNVPLANGLNIISAHARTSSARRATASVRVKYFGGTPQIAITAPLAGTHTGALTADVSGTYANIDPATITVNGSVAQIHAQSDTTGTFTVSSVALAANAKTTITASARNRANVSVTATSDVTNDGTASITIATPADNSYYSSATNSVHITGSYTPVQGSLVQVNGVNATLDGSGQFAADLDVSTATSSFIPVVARVSTADGQSATDAIRVIRFSGALAVRDTFPSQNAVEVDAGSLLVLLFNNSLDGSTVQGALRLTDAAGAVVDGETFVDNDAVSFAPVTPLTAGMHYTLTVSQTLKDLAGGSLSAPYSLGFTVASTAPATPPTVDQTDSAGCYTKTTITGKATTPGARVRLDVDGVTLTTTSDATTGNFSFTFTFSGQPGYHIARVRQIGIDGTLSPERAVCYRINCAGPQVLSALLDRAAKTIKITFSKPMKLTSLVASPAGSILIVPNNGTALNGNVALNAGGDIATVTFTNDVATAAVVLTVKKTAEDTTGQTMAADYSQTFAIGSDTPTGGYVSGAVYDATNGRPLAGAQVDITAPVSAFSRRGASAMSTSKSNANRMQPVVFANGPAISDDHGRYTRPLDEGAYTIQAAAAGYTTVWRQIIVPAGTGVVPIDIRLTKRGAEVTSSGAALALQNGGDTAITKKVNLAIPAGAITSGTKITLTSVGAQSLAGLLPLGWSPAGAAEVLLSPQSSVLSTGTITFNLSAADVAAITAAHQTLSLVTYDSDRDEWRVLSPVANIGSDGKVAFDIPAAGNYALVYPDNAASLAHPPVAHAGAPLAGVANPCGTTPDVCRLTSKSFDFAPKSVLPNGRAVATLVTDGLAKTYPSGTAVQAFIDEQLNLADGRVVIDPPFATDLLVYRNFAGDSGIADFHLSPTTQATAVTLRDGVDHVRVVDYPGRIDRGALIGSEGGRVPGDDGVTIDIPSGATAEALHASAASIANLAQFPAIPGFHVAGAFTLSLTRATEPAPIDTDGDGKFDPVAPPVLTKSARATFAIPTTPSQVIVAELMPSTMYGAGVRLAAQAGVLQQNVEVPNVKYFTTKSIDASILPVDGIVRTGTYLILTADNPIAFAKGTVIVGGGTAPVAGARVTAGIGSPVQSSTLGVVDITRAGGTFAVPVAAKPAAPFSLVPRTVSVGDGAAWPATSSPDPDQVVNAGAIPLYAKPPHLTSLTPANGTVKNANDPFVVTATFDTAMDTSAAALNGAIVVTNVTKETAVSGTITAAANIITFTSSAKFDAGTQYSVTLLPRILAANGAIYGKTTVSVFSTPAIPPADGSIHPELIRITIPDANGKSIISGRPGALPAGAQALAIRRGLYFVTLYQATVAADKSFSFEVGGGADAITMSDLIDLQVIDPVSRAITAIIPLTPFVTADGTGFIAPTDRTVTFTSDDGTAVTVPAGAFDTPTIITVKPSTKAAIAAVPSVDEELTYTASVNLEFDGVAKKRIEVAIPVPANTDTSNRQFMLAVLGQSARGPRLMVVDTLRIDGGKFTTAFLPGEQSAPTTRVSAFSSARGARPMDTLTGSAAKKFLLGVNKSGIYNVMDIRNAAAGVVWGVMDGLQGAFDFFWDQFASLFASADYCQERGRIAIPLLPNKAFTVVGVDASTGLQAFSKAYDPIPPGDPGSITVIPSANPPKQGPFPSFAEPFRIETLTVDAPDTDITTIRNFNIKLESGYIKVTDKAPVLPADLKVTLFDVTNGNASSNRANLQVAGKPGDRIMLMIEQTDVDPNVGLSVLFSNNLFVGPGTPSADDIDTYFKTGPVISFDTAPEPQNPGDPVLWAPAPDVRYSVDSGTRRLLIKLPSSLQRGNRYRLRLSTQIKDNTDPATGGTPLFIGQAVIPSPTPGGSPTTTGPVAMDLYFRVRAPAGLLSSFDLYNNGHVRDQALNGNVLFTAALDGGFLAYDSSDPLLMSDKKILGYNAGAIDEWSVATDHHGRVYTTGVGSMFGILRSYRLEDFLKAHADHPDDSEIKLRVVNPRASTPISFAVGASVNTALPSATILSNMPEAIPRKLQILLQDRTSEFKNLDAFKNLVVTTDPTLPPPPPIVGVSIQSAGPAEGDFEFYKATIARDPDPAAPAPKLYVGQRITVENVTLDMRWSADAYLTAPAVIDGIVARKNDKLRIIWNEKTYGVVSLFGYGIGVYDLNAIESNKDPHRDLSTYRAIREQVRITNAPILQACHPPDPPLPPGMPIPKYEPPVSAIPDLTFTPDAAILPKDASPDLKIFAVDALRGILDVTVHPPTTAAEAAVPGDAVADLDNPATAYLCAERPEKGLVFQKIYQDDSGLHYYYHPRIEKLRAKFTPLTPTATSPARPPFGRFSSASYYHWQLEKADNKVLWTTSGGTEIGARGSKAGEKVSRDYLLVPGNEYGLLIVEVGGTKPDPATTLDTSYEPLLDQHLVDIIWFPAGCYAARAIPRTNLATAIDGEGRVLIVDLSRIDERFKPTGGLIAYDELFPTVDKALNANGPYGIGKDDPRIVWKSDKHLAQGTLPPWVDPDTGFMFLGKLLTTTTQVISAIDPHVTLKVDLGAPDGLSEVGGIVPLGIEPPSGIVPANKPDASLGAFRVELSLPGALAEELTASGKKVKFALESERVQGAPTEQTPDGFPRSELRLKRRDGTDDLRPVPSNFLMQRLVPPSKTEQLRHQRGFNKFVSPWIIALADARAAKDYNWTYPAGVSTDDQKKDFRHKDGCDSCKRPVRLEGLGEADGVFEWYSSGRLLCVRPEADLFTGTNYAFLGNSSRLDARFATVMADVIHPPSIAVAAQNPPVADGMFQATTYLHSGEVETHSADLDAGGRGGWNVVIDRNYRSRTFAGSPLGFGWDSSMFARLRLMPSGAVEYRDGSGETYTFEPLAGKPAEYFTPKGLHLTLNRTDRGWQLRDKERRFIFFDRLGRITARTDHFASAEGVDAGTALGNIIRYVYDSTGRLVSIVDPMQRVTNLTYWEPAQSSTLGYAEGKLHEITDWRSRVITYEYDTRGRLMNVKLPEAAKAADVPPDYDHTSGQRPRLNYFYESVNPASNFTNYVDFAGNLDQITDPEEVKNGGFPRVIFIYDTTSDPVKRDHIHFEQAPCGSYTGSCVSKQAVFVFNSPTDVGTFDLLDQQRHYDLIEGPDKRMHIQKATAADVPIVNEVAATTLPDKALPSLSPVDTMLKTEFTEYDDHGQVKSATLPDGSTIRNKYKIGTDKATSTPVPVLDKSILTGGGISLHSQVHYETAPTADAIVTEIGHDYSSDLDSTVASQDFRESQSPNRSRRRVVHTDSHDSAKTKNVTSYNDFGQEEWSEQLDSANSETPSSNSNEPNTTQASLLKKKEYKNDTNTTTPIERGRLSKIVMGDAQRSLTVQYSTLSNGGQRIKTTDLNRQIETIEEFDAHDNLIHRVRTSTITNVAGPVPTNDIVSEESFGYDYSGRVAYVVTRQKGVTGNVVISTSTYDSLGRVIETHVNNAKVDDSDAELVTKYEYDLIGHVTKEYDPVVTGSLTTAARTETYVDGLGRTVRTRRVSGALNVEQKFGYDLHGNLCYETDTQRVATLHVFDVVGREVRTIQSDGIHEIRTFNPWDEITDLEMRARPSNILFRHTAWQRTPKGFAYSTGEQVETSTTGSTRTRTTGIIMRNNLIGSGIGGSISTVRVAVGETAAIDASVDTAPLARIEETLLDKAGRATVSRSGQINTSSASGGILLTPMLDNSVFSQQTVEQGDFDGALPRKVTTQEPRVQTSYATTTQYDGLDRPTQVTEAGGASSSTDYDEIGNVTHYTAPGETSESLFTYDSRGLVIDHTLQANSATVHSKYDALGNTREYKDEEGKITFYHVDGLGRVDKTTYPDGTFEQTEFEPATGAVHASRDRAGQWLVYGYDDNGRVKEVKLGGTGATSSAGDLLVRYEYDVEGRLTAVRNANAATEYADYDMLGRPGTTRAIRYKSASGLGSSPDVLDVHTQGHVWSVFDGERSRWRMPVAGSTVPSSTTPDGWRSWIDETHDGGGNIDTQHPTTSGTGSLTGPPLTHSTARSAGRPMQRKILKSGNPVLTTRYGYADTGAVSFAPDGVPAIAPAPGPATGLIGRTEAIVGGTTLGGAETTRTQTRRVSRENDLGLVGRRSTYGYESARQRYNGGQQLEHATGLPVVVPGETLFDADFRAGRSFQPPLLDATQIASLGDAAKTVVPPNWTVPETDAHQLLTPRTTTVGSTTVDTLPYEFTGGRRTTSGKWTVKYDELGHLTHLELANDRKIDFVYDANDRLVGRDATRFDGTAWVPENRDPLPASATFVWDPISDHLVAVYEEGASTAASAPGSTPGANAGLVQQYLHGDHGADDPVDVLIASSAGATPVEYLPQFDESGNETLQTIFNADGTLAERVLYADAYGDAPRYLQGALADLITVKATTDGAGNVTEVVVSAHVSEKLIEASLAGNVQLSSITANKTTAFTSSVTPVLDDSKGTLVWTLDGAAWQALTGASGADALEVALGSGLRFSGWGAAPLMKTPEWTAKLFSTNPSDDWPVVVRERFANLTATWASNPGQPAKIYDIPVLYLAASPVSRTHLITSWKAAPFADPGTGLLYYRARWYDPSTGAWLTPDPWSYRDSSNTYAFGAADPVNRSDPSGEIISGLIDLGFTLWDAYQCATGKISKGECAFRMALNAVALTADVFTGGFGGGTAVRAIGLAGRLGRAGEILIKGVIYIDRANTLYTTAQAGISYYEAVQDGNYVRAGLSAVQVILAVRGMRNTDDVTQMTAKMRVQNWSPTYSQAHSVRDKHANPPEESHHIIQDAAARTGAPVPGHDSYAYGTAPAVNLGGGSRFPGSQHDRANDVQRFVPFGRTYGAERQVAWLALRVAGFSRGSARSALRRADAYFVGHLGWTMKTPLAIPGGRP